MTYGVVRVGVVRKCPRCRGATTVRETTWTEEHTERVLANEDLERTEDSVDHAETCSYEGRLDVSVEILDVDERNSDLPREPDALRDVADVAENLDVSVDKATTIVAKERAAAEEGNAHAGRLAEQLRMDAEDDAGDDEAAVEGGSDR